MALFRRIAVAVDGSPTSRIALRAAIALAQDQKAALRIVLVVDVITGTIDSPYDMADYEDSVRRAADRILQQAAVAAHKARIDAQTVRLEVRALGDRIADEIARNAKSWRSDLIVIGTHGRRGLSHLFLGSVAETLIRIAPAPVLLIRGRGARRATG
jgi:nucleotide-binding universal stress UspA family protein